MDLYKSVSLGISRHITRNYSTSFTLGIQTLHNRLHDPIYAIYGFVRVADEIVDTFHDHDKAKLLTEFTEQTWQAIREKVSTNPVLHSFQWVVNTYGIEEELISAFLKSMEMDLHFHTYNSTGYSTYIYGSAEVVGLMCLRVFCEGDEKEYEKLKGPARKLGAAFQKVNFLRDMKSDFKERGRVYFPGVDFSIFNDHMKTEIESEIEADFREAIEGIKQLPSSSRFGVYVAYIYYQALLSKIKNLPARTIQEQRVRVPNNQKVALLFSSWFRFRFNFL